MGVILTYDTWDDPPTPGTCNASMTVQGRKMRATVVPWGKPKAFFFFLKAKMGDGVSQCSEEHENFFFKSPLLNHYYYYYHHHCFFLHFLCVCSPGNICMHRNLLHSKRFFSWEGHPALLTRLKAIWTFVAGFVMHFHDAFMGLTFFLVHSYSCFPISQLRVTLLLRWERTSDC